MGGGRKTTTLPLKEKSETPWSVNCSVPARNLRKSDLAAVIFGCKHGTIKECLFTQLFGLPAPHFSYIKNITPGLVLFLFNYSERKLYGIYEAVSPGQLNINPYAWTADGTELTPYPAQVRVRVRRQCEPLSEEKFGPIIAGNYYGNRLFWFELDRDQTNQLISLFSSSTGNASSSSHKTAKWNSLFRSLPAPHRKQSDNDISNLESEAGVRHADGAALHWSAWEFTPLSKETSLVEASTEVEAGKVNSQRSYSSVVSNTTLQQAGDKTVKLAAEANFGHSDQKKLQWSSWDTSARSTETDVLEPSVGVGAAAGSQTMNWSALFKPPAPIEATKNDAKCMIQETSSNMEWGSVSPCTDWESSHSLEDQGDEEAARDYDEECTNMGPDQPYAEVTGPLQENMDWGSSSFSSHLDGQTQSSELSLNEIANEIYNDLTETPINQKPNCKLPYCSAMTNETNSEEKHQRDTSHPLSIAEPHFEERRSSVAEMLTRRMPSDLESLVFKLTQEIEGLKASQLEKIMKVDSLEQQLVESKLEIQQLKHMLQGGSYSSNGHAEADHNQSSKPQPQFDDSVLIVGGFDGSSWSLSLDSYCLSHDSTKSLSPMTFARSYSSAAKLNGELYLLGGVNGDMWYDTVESYDRTSNKWVTRPPLNKRKGSLAGASLGENIFAIGGGNGVECFADVEMLDLNLGRWLSTRSMQHKRFAPAAVELNSALYVVGGYDGRNYLKTVERFDPREHAWTGLGSLSASRGCHSLVVLNEKLYAIGGYDGGKMVPSVEVFDPRIGSWMIGDPMNDSRGYFGAFVIREKIYVVGGLNNTDITDTIECYKEGCGWEVTNLKAVGKRCFFSAMVL